MVVLKRVLTRKSILNFGYTDVRDLSVQMMLDLGNHDYLINAYFNLEKIDFIEDILDELGITLEFQITKPSKNYDLGKEFLKHRYSNLSNEDKLKNFRKNKSRDKARVVSSIKRKEYAEKKGYLKAKNQGNFKK
jgi:hypothetical protein